MKSLLLFLTISLATIDVSGQVPPMPPMPTITTITTITTPTPNPTMIQPRPRVDPIWKRPVTFTANCPSCRTTNSGLRPLLIVTNGWTATNGGSIGHRTITLPCRNCNDTFDSQNTIFVPASIATEDPVITPMNGGGASSVVPAWTTDPNLRLSIQLTNFLTAIPWPTVLQIPAHGPVLLQMSNNVATTQALSGPISVICGPAVVIKYPTEIGKTYKCQASDDAKQTWIDGLLVAGTGGTVVQYEAAIKTNRMYRVVENPV